jgi:Fe-S cluster assembly ATP-binding protein
MNLKQCQMLDITIDEMKQSDKILFTNCVTTLDKRATLLKGENGTGKTTLLRWLAGISTAQTQGKIVLKGAEDSLFSELPAEERALQGLFSIWQHPPALYGLGVQSYLRTLTNLHRIKNHLDPLDPYDFDDLFLPLLPKINLPADWGNRRIDHTLSGGERKKTELLQILLTEPAWILCDEVEAGLDVDTQQVVASLLNSFIDKGVGLLLVSHQPSFYEKINLSRALICQDKNIKEATL